MSSPSVGANISVSFHNIFILVRAEGEISINQTFTPSLFHSNSKIYQDFTRNFSKVVFRSFFVWISRWVVYRGIILNLHFFHLNKNMLNEKIYFFLLFLHRFTYFDFVKDGRDSSKRSLLTQEMWSN